MTKWLLIGAGGAAGSMLRYALAGLAQRLAGGSFPVGTLLVNVTGCLAIGFLGAALTGPYVIREEYRIALLVGLLGGYTTFSSFGWETLALLNDGQMARATANVLLCNGLGLAAVWLGYRLAERL
ncbi:MAG: fluoride efflux transporter CrcB [Planctomycetes bacterium]|nr:fluoride efflux transporter CrcB [Planctomycetota bacterium]